MKKIIYAIISLIITLMLIMGCAKKTTIILEENVQEETQEIETKEKKYKYSFTLILKEKEKYIYIPDTENVKIEKVYQKRNGKGYRVLMGIKEKKDVVVYIKDEYENYRKKIAHFTNHNVKKEKMEKMVEEQNKMRQEMIEKLKEDGIDEEIFQYTPNEEGKDNPQKYQEELKEIVDITQYEIETDTINNLDEQEKEEIKEKVWEKIEVETSTRK